MTLKFYAETHIAKAVTNQLVARGVNISRAEEVGLQHALDDDHLEYATREGRILITGDQDFLALHADYQAKGRVHAGIIHISSYLLAQGERAYGVIVEAIFFFVEAEQSGAADYMHDFYNQVRFLNR